MKLSKRLLSKTVALAAICATMATAAFAAPQGTFDTSEIQITGQASRSVAPSYAILTLGITSQNTNINAAKSNNDRIMSDLISRLANLGVDKKDIILEDKSTSTEQNIIFSKKFIPADKGFAVVTNYYHVYRALVQARTLGFRCIGYGSPTKFYFSLNAFIREFIGYLYFKRKIHAIVLGVLTFLFIAAVLFVEIYYWINY